jgi:hypothetical protein
LLRGLGHGHDRNDERECIARPYPAVSITEHPG